MGKWSKESIIDAYNSFVKERGGASAGIGVFLRESGIPMHYFKGGYWRSWSAFQVDAGHVPNVPTPKIADEELLRRYAELTIELGVIPTLADLRLKRSADPSFPSDKVFDRWGDKNGLLNKLAEYCKSKEQFRPVLELLKSGMSMSTELRLEAKGVKGFVYLLKSGKNYKLGRSNAVGRRLRELAIQLPEKPDTVHVIETDDPDGIEEYWHRRFAGKRQGGEWFALTVDDVKAFKRRKFQ